MHHATEAPTEADILSLMHAFERAFQARDVDGVMRCVTEDIEWCLPDGPDEPHGRIVQGRDPFRRALSERFDRMDDLAFVEFSDQVFGSTVIQRYVVRGSIPGRGRIHARGLDLYTIRDRLIAAKDAFWKNIRPAT